jgi:hypothetical protein
MATHGPCETEGPGLLPYQAPSGIEDITAGIRPRSARPARRRHGLHQSRRCRDRPAIMAGPGRG